MRAGAKRRTVKDCDAEIIALKRDLIEARTRAVTLAGQVARLEEQVSDEAKPNETIAELREEIEEAWEVLKRPKDQRNEYLADAIVKTIETAVSESDKAWEKRMEEEEKEAVDRDVEREAMLAALGMDESDWRREGWKWGFVDLNPSD